MKKILSRYKKIIIDFLYCLVSYALPVVFLQFIIQPLIANKTETNINDLFIVLYSAVKLIITVFITPLANLRLLKKKEGVKDSNLNKIFNFSFAVITPLCIVIGTIMNLCYRNFVVDFGDIFYFILFIFLICVHDFYSIEYRLELNYKKIIIDNVFTIIGYSIGILLFLKTLQWEYIFICGYLASSIYVLFTCKIWRTGISCKVDKKIFKEYGQLSTSAAFNSSTVYCDKLIIYPVLGNGQVSIYNAASVVSKAISVVITPLKNVFLSYIVSGNQPVIKKNALKKAILFVVVAIMICFVPLLFFNVLMCKFLYPDYAEAAKSIIPIIVVSVIVETIATILNVILLRFGTMKNQMVVSILKLSSYLISVIILSIVLKFGLVGFCVSLLITAIIHIVSIILYLSKCIKIE